MIVLGDLNADMGDCGGPLATSNPNEQGRILLRYLHKWNYVSVHLHTCTTFPTSTCTSEAHRTSGTIDHILCPEHLLPNFSNCAVPVDNLLNLSDHDPVCARLSCTLDVAPQQPKKFRNSHYLPD